MENNKQSADQYIKNFLKNMIAGQVCLHPAGTLYGLTCDPYNKAAVELLFKVKKRLPEKSLLHLTDQIAKAVRIWEPLPGKWEQILSKIWPNHLTVVWKLKAEFKDKFHNTDGTFGIRIAAYSVVKSINSSLWFEKILREFEYHVPTTIINYSGFEDLKKKHEIISFCKQHNVHHIPSFISDSEVVGIPSTIIKIISEDTFKVLRNGAFDASNLLAHNIRRI